MGLINNKVGQKFGRLTVIERADDYIKSNGKHLIQWLCKCDCGNTCVVKSNSLTQKSYGTKSCGCLNTEMRAKNLKNKFQDLTGQKFGRLTVESLNSHPQKGIYLWNCKCDCGNTCILKSSMLKSGNTQSCGCLQKELTSKRFFNDITGEKYGRLTVIHYAGIKHYPNSQVSMWHCKCDCGNECDVSLTSLRNGHSTSCGCIHKEMISKRSVKDITSQKFGRLTVIERCGTTADRKAKWKCICDCGNICYVNGKELRTGKIKSCGCLLSHGEEILKQCLKEYGVDYIPQYKFPDCKDISTLPFDIYLLNYNTAIEFQGKQHYEPVDFAGKGQKWAEEQFKIIQCHDKIKLDYCKSNNIKLIIIPYWKINNIKEILKEEKIIL